MGETLKPRYRYIVICIRNPFPWQHTVSVILSIITKENHKYIHVVCFIFLPSSRIFFFFFFWCVSVILVNIHLLKKQALVITLYCVRFCLKVVQPTCMPVSGTTTAPTPSPPGSTTPPPTTHLPAPCTTACTTRTGTTITTHSNLFRGRLHHRAGHCKNYSTWVQQLRRNAINNVVLCFSLT